MLKNGYTLRDINNQTYEICLIACKQNELVLIFVKTQTDKICIVANLDMIF